MVEKLSAIIKLVSGFQNLAGCDHFLVNVQIAHRISRFFFAMLNDNGRIEDIPSWGNRFMDTSAPAKAAFGTKEPFPVISKGRMVCGIKGGSIFHHHHIYGRVQLCLQLFQRFQLVRRDHIVSVQPHPVIHRCLFTGRISGCGEVLTPGIVKDKVSIA